MDPTILGAMGASILGGVVGNYAADGDQTKANRYIRDAAGNIIDTQAPTLNTDMPNLPQYQTLDPSQLQQYEWQGDLTAAQQGATELNKVYENPQLKEARMQALRQLQKISSGGGMTDEDKALLYQIQSQNAQKERGSREAILQNANARGVGGSGLELAAQLQAQQSSADRNAAESMSVNAQAQRRALEAMMQAEGIAGGMSREELARKMATAQAQDSINSFNTGLTFDASKSTWGAKQGFSNASVDQANNQYTGTIGFNNDVNGQRYQDAFGQTKYGNDVTGQQFGMDSTAAGMRAEGGKMLGGQYQGSADRTRDMWGGIGNTIGKGVAYYGAKPSAPTTAPTETKSPGAGATTTSKQPYETWLDDDNNKQSSIW